MTDTAPTVNADDATPQARTSEPATARPARPRRRANRPSGRPDPSAGETRPASAAPARGNPLLDQLAGFYPHLFGAEFLPLKRGIFQDLLAAHPDVFERDALKAALAFHTRSSRYLTVVASGAKRHDLQGHAVEDLAPEHVHHALLEIFRRRQARSAEDLKPKLRNRIVQAFEASGLSRADYAERVRTQDEASNTLLDEALAEAASRAARDEALLRAFSASGQSVDAFASAYGLDPATATRTLERARKRAAAATN
jgi:ProP effector